MIKDRNIAKDAGIQLTKILGATLGGQIPTGEIFWVGNDGDAAFESMAARVAGDRLYTDLDTCVGACTANRGDIIVCLEGFNQNVIAAAGLDLDVAGITIVFLGTGTSQAKITFTTSASADMDVDAADITLIRPKFVAGVDSLTGPIDVNSTDFKIIDGEWHDATDIETTDCIVATSGATRMYIDGWKFFHGTETGDQKQSHIQLNGCDQVTLKNIDIRGNFFVGCIENVTDEVLDFTGENWYLENLNATPKPALYLDANATGSMRNVKLKIASGTTYYSNAGKVSWDNQCQGFVGDGVGGDALGTGGTGSIEAVADTIASDLVISQSDLKIVQSDLKIVQSDVKVVGSDLIVLDAIVDTIASDLVVVMSDVKVINSDLIVADAIIDTIASDLVVVMSDLKSLLSDFTSYKAEWDTLETLVSDFVVKYESDNP